MYKMDYRDGTYDIIEGYPGESSGLFQEADENAQEEVEFLFVICDLTDEELILERKDWI